MINYKTCRGCRHFKAVGTTVSGGSCALLDCGDIELDAFWEDGVLHGVIEENLNIPNLPTFENLLATVGLSGVKQKRLLKALHADFEDAKPTIIETLNDAISQVLMKQDTGAGELEIDDPTTFYCSKWE